MGRGRGRGMGRGRGRGSARGSGRGSGRGWGRGWGKGTRRCIATCNFGLIQTTSVRSYRTWIIDVQTAFDSEWRCSVCLTQIADLPK